MDAAFDGDTVAICPGNYPEQVKITKAITVSGIRGFSQPVITAPPGGVVQNTTDLSGFPIAAQILVEPSAPLDVTVRNLIVDGANNNLNSCAVDLEGVYYKNAGGSIVGTTERNQLLPEGLQGCQDGLGIFVESDNTSVDKISITNNTVTNFDKNGITVDHKGANADIVANTVTGMGPTDVIAQNGIQVAYGATANITGNTISNLIYSPETTGSSGIIMYDLQASVYAAPSTVQKNHITNAQYGVVLDAVEGQSGGSPVQVAHNTITNAQFAGIGLYSDNYFTPGESADYINVAVNTIQNTNPYDGIDVCSDHNTILKNKVSNSNTEAAIHLDGLCTEPDNSQSGVDNTVDSNKISVACVGILSGPPAEANDVEKNKFSDVQQPIVYGQDAYSCSGPHALRHPAPGRKKGAPKVGALSPLRRR